MPNSSLSLPNDQDARDMQLLERAYEALLAELRHGGKDAPRDRLDRAFELAQRSHRGQRRKSGEPYLIHPLRVSRTIARLGLDLDCVIAGILHDSVEDSDLTLVELGDLCGDQVARLVDGVTKLGKLPFLDRQRRQVESFRKFVLAMSQDVRVLLLKLADRLDNMRTLEAMPARKQARIARETMDIYAPLAGRLGIDVMRSELQDLAFRYSDAATYQEVNERMQRVMDEDPGFASRVQAWLLSCFDSDNPVTAVDEVASAERVHRIWNREQWGTIRVEPKFRTVYRVHRSEQHQREREQERARESAPRESADLRISDVVTFQIIAQSRDACYMALAHLHAVCSVRSRDCQDFIAIPKQNRYQALHTSIFTEGGHYVDVHISSEMMNEIAERGVVADLRRGRESDPGTMQWLRDVSDSHSKLQDPTEFFTAVKDELFAEEVYVSTPQGETFALPRKSTPIDFAFFIHTEVGLHCSGARVNGQFVPLRYQLRSGDTVEILNDPRVRPKPEWINMCASSRARTRINQYLRQTERIRNAQLGSELLAQELERRAVALELLEQHERFESVLGRFGLARDRGLSALQEAIGAGVVGASEFLAEVLDHEAMQGRRRAGFFSRVFSAKETQPSASQRKFKITREALDGMGVSSIRLGECCSPVPGDAVTGVVRGDGEIVAHVDRCRHALNASSRRLELEWDPALRLERPVTLRVVSRNREGLLAQMSRAFAELGLNIRQANCRAFDHDKRAVNTFDVTMKSATEMRDIMTKLRNLPGIYSVERIFRYQGKSVGMLELEN